MGELRWNLPQVPPELLYDFIHKQLLEILSIGVASEGVPHDLGKGVRGDFELMLDLLVLDGVVDETEEYGLVFVVDLLRDHQALEVFVRLCEEIPCLPPDDRGQIGRASCRERV